MFRAMVFLQRFIAFITLLNSSAAVSDEDDFVFGVIGSSVTITSQIKGPREFSSIIWYHETITGDINILCIFTKNGLHRERFRGTSPNYSNKTLLTISNAAMSDTGRYFVILEFKRTFTSGSAQYFIVTDTSDPVVSLYQGTDALGSPMFFCEVTGAGGDWSDPLWLIEGEDERWLEGTTAKRMGSDRVFTRWSTLRLNSTLNVSCMCYNQNKTSFLVRSSELDVPMGHSACDLLIILSPLCLLFILFTSVLVILWARMVRRLKNA